MREQAAHQHQTMSRQSVVLLLQGFPAPKRRDSGDRQVILNPFRRITTMEGNRRVPNELFRHEVSDVIGANIEQLPVDV